MTIAYLIDYDINTTNGVMQKIFQQAAQWIKNENNVYFVSSKNLTIYDSDKKSICQMKPLTFKFGRFGTALKLLFDSYSLAKLLENIQFDMIYMRYRLYMPFFTEVLKKYKVIMEINSDDTIEYELHSYLTHIYNKYTRDFVLNKIDGFVSVSFELKDRFSYLNKPIDVIANGINTLEYSINIRNNTERLTLVFIGTPNQPWHGLDKIIDMAENFKEYQFYIIGCDGKDTNNLKYFGYLSKEESTNIIQKSDIGIGTLSLYKTGLNEASPLKSRHYLACGLPLIYAYIDTDLTGDEKFALRLSNTKENIAYKKIKEFLNNILNNKTEKNNARKFAEKFLDYTIKEKKRLKFFQKVLNEK